MYVCNFCKIYNFVRYISKKKKKIVNMLVIGMLNFNFMIMLKNFVIPNFLDHLYLQGCLILWGVMMLGDDILGLIGDGVRRGCLGLRLGDRGVWRSSGEVRPWSGDDGRLNVGEVGPLLDDGEGMRIGLDDLGEVGDMIWDNDSNKDSPEKPNFPPSRGLGDLIPLV